MANYVRLGAPDVEQVIEANKKMRAVPADVGGYGGVSEVASGKIASVLRGHPGGAWAANVDALNKVGGLIDYSILGAGDHYMAHALIGMLDTLVSRKGELISSHAHAKKLYAWQDRAEHWIKRDVGFVHGTILHDFHGPKMQRGYGSRWRILTDGQYDPDTDIKYDAQGLLQLETVSPRQIRMRDQIRAYFRSRSEDDTK